MFELSDGVETLEDALRRIDVRYKRLSHGLLKEYLVHGDLELFDLELSMMRLERDLDMFIATEEYSPE